MLQRGFDSLPVGTAAFETASCPSLTADQRASSGARQERMDAGAGVGSLPSCFPCASQKPNAQGQCTERPCEAKVPTRCFDIRELLTKARVIRLLLGVPPNSGTARSRSRA